MKPTAPYYLQGEAGKALGLEQVSLADLCVYNATLSLRSLDVDVLQFQLLASHSRTIPDDGQWISLFDSTGARLFTGIAKRTYTHPQGLYSYVVSNVYLGMTQTSLLSANGRPYVTYDQGDLRDRLLSILSTATAEGLPIQPPSMASTPALFDVPKMSFRAASLAGSLEDTLKWAPDATTRMDYSTNPPTLRFYTRTDSAATTIDLDSSSHHATAVQLAAWPEARALSVAFVYAERAGDTLVMYRIQKAGDDTAEARRKLSVYLSGSERTDMLVSEALVNANNAALTANAALEGAKAAVKAVNDATYQTYLDSLSSLPAATDSFDLVAYVIAQDSALAAYPSLGWSSAYSITLHNACTWTGATDYSGTTTQSKVGLRYSSTGWAVAGSPFTAAQLALAGATQTAGTITGNVIANVSDGLGYRGFPSYISGWPSYYYISQSAADADYRQYCYHPVSVAVNFLSKAPSVIRAALETSAAATYNSSLAAAVATTGATALTSKAEYVDAPPNLAANYFARQDWTPYKGRLSLDPTAVDFPAPGSFLNVVGDTVPAEWASMAAPVAELSLNLATGSAEITIGPSPRMDFQSLVDRLRIPPEDNYQPG